MTAADHSLTGGCLCGRVRYRADGDPNWVAYCHCRSCRRATGAPVTAYAGYPQDRVSFTEGAPQFYASSPGVQRGFCPQCGTPLTFAGQAWPGELHIHLGSLDDPEALVPEREGFAEERVSWVKSPLI